MDAIDREKIDYSQYEGRVIRYVQQSDWPWANCDFAGRVIGCDFYVGITIVDDSDPDKYLWCLHGPSSPMAKELYEEMPGIIEEYSAMFDEAVAGIEVGSIIRQIGLFEAVDGRHAGSDTCPFGA